MAFLDQVATSSHLLIKLTAKCFSSHTCIQDISIKGEHFYNFVWSDSAASNKGESVALVNDTTGEEFTFDACVATAKRLSVALYDQIGARKGDVVAIMMPNCPGMCFITLDRIL
jgi:hypothetical protein